MAKQFELEWMSISELQVLVEDYKRRIALMNQHMAAADNAVDYEHCRQEKWHLLRRKYNLVRCIKRRSNS